MNDAVLSKLPRFDAPQDSAAGGLRLAQANGAAVLAMAAGTDAPTGAEDTPPVFLPRPVLADAAPAAQPALDSALMALGAAVDEMRQASREQTSLAIAALAASLFPKLSRLFLAEELARHLPALIPDAVDAVEIRAAPALAKSLQRASERIAPLPDRVSICALETLAPGRVDVTWATGGFEFEFDALLGKCLARMNVTPASSRD